MEQTTLNFDAARGRAETGIQRAADRAERADPGWTQRAADLLRIGASILTGQHRADFTIEELRTLVDGALPQPPDGRAWGAATRAATKAGFIERVPGAYRAAASSNGSPKPVYRKGPAA